MSGNSSLLHLISCNNNKSEEEMKELWSKAQTKQAIINRSGTKFNSALDMDLAMRDAETRLQSGGGLLGNDGLSVSGIINQDNKSKGSVGTFGMPINLSLIHI